MCARREASGALHLPCCLTPSTRRTTPAIASTARQGTTHQHPHASLSMHSPTCCLTLHAVQTHIHPALYHMHIASPSALFRRTLRTHYVSHPPPHAHTSPQHSRRCPALIVCCCVLQDEQLTTPLMARPNQDLRKGTAEAREIYKLLYFLVITTATAMTTSTS